MQRTSYGLPNCYSHAVYQNHLRFSTVSGREGNGEDSLDDCFIAYGTGIDSCLPDTWRLKFHIIEVCDKENRVLESSLLLESVAVWSLLELSESEGSETVNVSTNIDWDTIPGSDASKWEVAVWLKNPVGDFKSAPLDFRNAGFLWAPAVLVVDYFNKTRREDLARALRSLILAKLLSDRQAYLSLF